MSGRATGGYLHQRRQGWYLEVAIPPSARAAFGGKTKLIRSLKTRDKSEARNRRFGVYAEMRRDILAALNGSGPPSLWNEAMRLRTAKVTQPGRANDEEGNRDILLSLIGEEAERVRRAHGHDVADRFYDVASGAASLLDPLFEEWLREIEGQATEQTRAAHKQAKKELLKHLGQDATVEHVTRRVAGDAIREALWFGERGAGSTPKKRNARTVRRLVSSLSSFWRWLRKRGIVNDNPWSEQAPPKPKGKTKAEYTNEELVKLLAGKPRHRALPDLIRMSLFSGARLNELASLLVKDIGPAQFHVRNGKGKFGTRTVPIHSVLAPIFARRTEGKKPEEPLFPELPLRGPDKRRGWGVSQIFTRYRRGLKIEDGRDFHSLRRTAITAMDNAGIPQSWSAQVVGHAKQELTYGLYSGGVKGEPLREAIEAIEYSAEVMQLV